MHNGCLEARNPTCCLGSCRSTLPQEAPIWLPARISRLVTIAEGLIAHHRCICRPGCSCRCVGACLPEPRTARAGRFLPRASYFLPSNKINECTIDLRLVCPNLQVLHASRERFSCRSTPDIASSPLTRGLARQTRALPGCCQGPAWRALRQDFLVQLL